MRTYAVLAAISLGVLVVEVACSQDSGTSTTPSASKGSSKSASSGPASKKAAQVPNRPECFAASADDCIPGSVFQGRVVPVSNAEGHWVKLSPRGALAAFTTKGGAAAPDRASERFQRDSQEVDEEVLGSNDPPPPNAGPSELDAVISADTAPKVAEAAGNYTYKTDILSNNGSLKAGLQGGSRDPETLYKRYAVRATSPGQFPIAVVRKGATSCIKEVAASKVASAAFNLRFPGGSTATALAFAQASERVAAARAGLGTEALSAVRSINSKADSFMTFKVTNVTQGQTFVSNFVMATGKSILVHYRLGVLDKVGFDPPVVGRHQGQAGTATGAKYTVASASSAPGPGTLITSTTNNPAADTSNEFLAAVLVPQATCWTDSAESGPCMTNPFAGLLQGEKAWALSGYVNEADNFVPITMTTRTMSAPTFIADQEGNNTVTTRNYTVIPSSVVPNVISVEAAAISNNTTACDTDLAYPDP